MNIQVGDKMKFSVTLLKMLADETEPEGIHAETVVVKDIYEHDGCKVLVIEHP